MTTSKSIARRALPFFISFVALACATTTPAELIDARAAFTRVSTGPAANLDPTDVHKAQVALAQAEQSFASEKDSQKTIDLAYIAARMAEIAEAKAAGATAEASESVAKQGLADKQAQRTKQTQADLVTTRDQLAESQRAQATAAQQTDVERAARQDADKKASESDLRAIASEKLAADANDALAKLAAKEDERGTVITLSGSVLFRSNDSILLPAAQTRLDQVAEALVAKGKNAVVQGYTDSRGSLATNMSLSQRRAESVRSYLVTRGVPFEKISAEGMGPDRPIAENTNAEGRANNRRVEIVIAKAPSDAMTPRPVQ